MLVAIRRLIPPRYRSVIQDWFLKIRALLYRGNQKTCPCCGWNLRRFIVMQQSHVNVPSAYCPRCHSQERHRWIWLYLQEHTSIQTANVRLLHFAPEYCYYRLFETMPNIDVLRTDLNNRQRVMVRQDVTRLALPEHTFDGILCTHVLEHVPNDRAAMRELFRVLKPGGWAVLNVPTKMDQPTYEDFSITDPEARRQAFGQWDHVRWYGYDYADRLQAAGFDVNVEYARDLSPALIERYGLRQTEILFFCTRPE